jgi:RHS repeat-associated protein
MVFLLAQYTPQQVSSGLARSPASSAGGAYDNIDSSGAYRTAVPIEVPLFHGLEPSLSLVYNSNAGNDWIGVGWNLAGYSIIRRASPGKGVPRYDNSDVFLLDGLELIPCTSEIKSPSCKYPAPGNYVPYTTKIESFQRIAYNVPGKWYIWTKTGTKLTYTANIFSVGSWRLSKVEDTLGNSVAYESWYDSNGQPSGHYYLDTIKYNRVEIKFYSELRPDLISEATGRDLEQIRYRLKTIDITVGGTRARTYALTYTSLKNTARSFLTEVRQFGTDAQLDPSGEIANISSISSLPPFSFELPPDVLPSQWGQIDNSDAAWGIPTFNDPLPPIFNGVGFLAPSLDFVGKEDEVINRRFQSHLGDFDGDGRTDWLILAPTEYNGVYEKIEIVTALAGKSAPVHGRQILDWIGPIEGDAGEYLKIADVNGDGRTDILYIIYVNYPDPEVSYTRDLSIHLLVALSRGDGRFEWATSSAFSTGWISEHADVGGFSQSRIMECETGDINGDNRHDLVCNQTKLDGSDHIYTALALGDGTFNLIETEAQFSSDRPSSVLNPMTIGDSNGDRLDDLMILDYTPCPYTGPGVPPCIRTHEIVTAFSQGDGSYQYERVPTSWTVPAPYEANLVNADISGDGKTDIVLFQDLPVTTASPDGTIFTAIRAPDGDYALNQQTFPVGLLQDMPLITMGDADGDGNTDLMVMSRQEPGLSGCSTSINFPHVNLHRVLSRGNGYFDLPSSWSICQNSKELDIQWKHIAFPPAEPNAPDLNGDGTADFLLDNVNSLERLFLIKLHEDISPGPSKDTFSWRAAEVNGDGRTDWVYIRYTPQGPYIHTMLAGDNSYTQMSQPSPPGANLSSVIHNWNVADVNGDGRDDLIYPSMWPLPSGMQMNTWLSNGNGTWKMTIQPVFSGPLYRLEPTERNMLNWRPLDVNGDGQADMVFISQWSRGLLIRMLLSTGDGKWIERFDIPAQRWAKTDILNWRPADVNGDGRGDLIYLEDFQGGIKIHTSFSNGDGTWTDPTDPNSSFSLPRDPRDPGTGSSPFETRSWRVMDINADGLTDLVLLRPTNRRPDQATGLHIYSLLSHGNGKDWTVHYTPPDAMFLGDMMQWRGANIDDDGRADLIHIRVSPPAINVNVLNFSEKDGWRPKSPVTYISTVTRTTTGVFFKLADVNGDDRDDLTRFDLLNPGMRLLSLTPRFQPELLTSITNGLGGSSEISYEPWSKFVPNDSSSRCHLPVGVGVYVVGEIRVNDGRTPTTGTQTFSYSCVRWSYAERTYLGWEDVTASRPASEHRPSNSTLTHYTISDECLVQPASIRVFDSKGKEFIKSIISYVDPDPYPPYLCLINYQNSIELNKTNIGQNSYTHYHYDEFGNVDLLQELGNPLISSDDRVIVRGYHSAKDQYIVGLPSSETVRAGSDSSGRIESSKSFCYDNDTTLTCLQSPTKGLLTTIKELNRNGLAGLAETNLFYDAYGNLAGVRDSNGHGKGIYYDQTYHIFPEILCNALNQCQVVEWNSALGQIKKVTDANGKETELNYDVFGRLIETDYPNGGKVQRVYVNWGDPTKQHVHEWVDDSSTDGLWTDSYVDGLGRTYQILQEGNLPGKTSILDMIYADSTDIVYQESHWYAKGDMPVIESFEYDALGRLISLVHPDGNRQRFAYGNDADLTWIAAYDERGSTRKLLYDAHGRLSKVIEQNQGIEYPTTYSYNSLDQLDGITDSGGNQAIYTYDWRGRRLYMSDPDLGEWNYRFDKVGNLQFQTDARGLTVELTYDELDRVKTKSYPNGRKIIWNYDEPGHGASLGRLTSIIDSAESRCPNNISRDFTYDEMGKVIVHKQCIEGLTYEFQFRYDKLGRIEWMKYPDREEVTYGYNAAGQLATMPGYVNSISYDAAGRLVDVVYANQTHTVFSYNSQREWLENVSVSAFGSTLYQAGYEYYPNGLIEGTYSSTNKMNLKFEYDGMDRLTDVSGDLPQIIKYDGLGNITFNSQVGTYNYKTGVKCGQIAPKNFCPHAVKKTLSADTQRLQEFTYDDNGNLTLSVQTDNGLRKQRSIEWNVDNQPIKIQDYAGVWTNVRYDAFGQRTYRERAGQVTQYYGDYMELSYHPGGGTRNTTQYYYAGPLLVARKEAADTYWYHQDHLASTRSMTDQSSTVVASFDYTPFGEVIPYTNPVKTDIQYSSHRNDQDNGLIDMNARYYDPQLARFISADPIIPNGNNPQALNRFSYVFNSPNTYLDSSGYQPQDTRGAWERFWEWLDRATGYEPPPGPQPIDPSQGSHLPPPLRVHKPPPLQVRPYVVQYELGPYEKQWLELELSVRAIGGMLWAYYEVVDAITMPAQMVAGIGEARMGYRGLSYAGEAALESAALLELRAVSPRVQQAGTTRLWRAIGERELADVVKFGDYHLHYNSTFKRFAFLEDDMNAFIRANPNKSYAKTYIDLPNERLMSMDTHPWGDFGGRDFAIGIDVWERPDFYEWFGEVNVLP